MKVRGHVRVSTASGSVLIEIVLAAAVLSLVVLAAALLRGEEFDDVT